MQASPTPNLDLSSLPSPPSLDLPPPLPQARICTPPFQICTHPSLDPPPVWLCPPPLLNLASPPRICISESRGPGTTDSSAQSAVPT